MSATRFTPCLRALQDLPHVLPHVGQVELGRELLDLPLQFGSAAARQSTACSYIASSVEQEPRISLEHRQVRARCMPADC